MYHCFFTILATEQKKMSTLVTEEIAWFPCPFPQRNFIIRVFYFLPQRWDKVLFVLHGILRNASNHLKHWVKIAAERGIAVLAPEFSVDCFPGDKYACGGVISLNSDGTLTLRERSAWSFSFIELAFDDFKQRSGSKAANFYIYGHSAGAQFVHRCFALEDFYKILL